MTHLTSDELLDVAEGARTAGSLPHLGSCEACRRQLDELRGVIAAAQVDVPEPSPLFWDHFSARVRAAVAAEPVAVPSWFGGGVRTWTFAGAMSAAIVVAVILTLRTIPRPGADARSPLPDSVATEAGSAPTADDPSFVLLSDLAGNLDWDGAVEAGIATDVGTAEKAVAELNAEERTELQRLLREAMSGSGA